MQTKPKPASLRSRPGRRACAERGPDGKHPCVDGLVDDLRMILGQQAIIVTVTDEHAIRAHDALIERGVTAFREAAG